ncbi:hypothetical protein DFH28DRAFT_909305 [Melampsora americana]|nr:hypothetical protein DFH28DRAFT_909305 [Melampsora americana]
MSETDHKQVTPKFCACTPNDQVRLIQAGFIGGTPVTPNLAITIRLLRFFYTVWKYCSLRFKPFAEALNNFMDAGNPLFLNRNGTPREWNWDLSSAIHAYCEMIVMAEEAIEKSLNLIIADKLDGICSPCFGPGVGPRPIGEHNHIVCLNGNFQHRKHLAASIEHGGISTPSLFLDIDRVYGFRTKMGQTANAGAANPGQCQIAWCEAEVVSMEIHGIIAFPFLTAFCLFHRTHVLQGIPPRMILKENPTGKGVMRLG